MVVGEGSHRQRIQIDFWIDRGMDGYIMKQLQKDVSGRLQAVGVQVFTVKFFTCFSTFENCNCKKLGKMPGLGT